MNVRLVVAGASLLIAAANPKYADAQRGDTAGTAAVARARALSRSGDAGAARALLDSMVGAAADGTNARAVALFWRAMLASDTAAAMQDYTTIVVDHALSAYAASALAHLGQIELARGDRQSARFHLERLVFDYAGTAAADSSWYWLGRARAETGELRGGCAAFDSARTHTASSDVERRKQIDFAQLPCRALAADTTRSAAASADTAPRRARWSAQVAAYPSRAGADSLVRRLKRLGYDARVDSLKLFHVRIGTFATRAEAAAFVAKMKQQGRTAIVVEVDGRDR